MRLNKIESCPQEAEEGAVLCSFVRPIANTTLIFVPAHKKLELSQIPKLRTLEIPHLLPQHYSVLSGQTGRGERVRVKRHAPIL